MTTSWKRIVKSVKLMSDCDDVLDKISKVGESLLQRE